MSKRFCDTDLWDKEWFMALSCKNKCLIKFLFDKCDAAGVWSANWALASSYIGEPVTEKDLENGLQDRVIKMSPGKFFLVEFIEFQYGTISENCKPHLKIIQLINKHGIILSKTIGYTYPIHRVEEKEEEKEEDKDKEKEEGGTGETTVLFAVPDEVPIDPETEYRIVISGIKIKSLDDFVHRNFPILCEELKMKLGAEGFYKKFLEFESRILDAKYFNDTEFRKHFSNYMHKVFPAQATSPPITTKTEQILSGFALRQKQREEEDRLNKQAS